MSNRLVLALAALPLMTDTTGTEQRSTAAAVHVVDDFEDGDRRARSGLSWIAIADDLMGGSSFADPRVTAPGARSRHALRVGGSLTVAGFAGAWVALDERARPVDLTDFEGIRLRIRGRGPFRVALRAGPMGGANYMAAVESGADWTQVAVPFADLKPMSPDGPPIDLRTARWLGVSTGSGRRGRFTLDVDDVELYASRADARLRVQDAPTFSVHFDAAPASEVPSGPWKELGQDASGDGKQKRLPDATALAVCVDEARDRLWFRIRLAGPLPKRWLGANLALDVDGDPSNGMAWWGTNTAFHFDRLVSVYGFEAGSGYEGMIGVADAAEVQAGNMNGSQGERVRFVPVSGGTALVIGIPRSALASDARGPIRLLAAVGSSLQHNDDVPNEGAATLGR
jgi:hypothetical protein